MSEARFSDTLRAIAEQHVPDGFDLWPSISARSTHRRAPRRLAHAAVLGGALLAAGLLPLTVPSARAALGQWVQTAGLVLIDSPAVEPTRAAGVAAPAAVGGSGGVVRADSSPIEDVRRRAAFRVCAPAWLPAGVQVTGGNVPSGDDAVVTFGRNPRGSGGGFIQQMRGPRQGGYLAPADRTVAVHVHGQPATYARGAWNGNRTWDQNADAGLLSWEEAGVTYVLSASGLGLSRDDMIRIADSCVVGK
jgi:hypothetical protein